ncbi:hypothetical protein KSP40_PGU009669 [Platanthera guangdongensis]|uniref:AT-hook motif nuclear-localized protein n=1 Tax=Platanthera guangdongensis TaxID=2320717 RepID=A0ABR2LP73_9ASPA
MEGRETMPFAGIGNKVAEVGLSFHSPPRMAAAAQGAAGPESLNPGGGIISPISQAAGASSVPTSTEHPPPMPPLAMPPMKKKRGRPRKYAPDGSPLPMNPKPISASMPPAVEYTPPALISMKRGRGRPSSLSPKQLPEVEQEQTGEMVACSAGANFTPHIITVATGEDVTMKIISFSQLGPRAICILSANGVISNATLRQPDSSGGTLTYEVSN